MERKIDRFLDSRINHKIITEWNATTSIIEIHIMKHRTNTKQDPALKGKASSLLAGCSIVALAGPFNSVLLGGQIVIVSADTRPTRIAGDCLG